MLRATFIMEILLVGTLPLAAFTVVTDYSRKLRHT